MIANNNKDSVFRKKLLFSLQPAYLWVDLWFLTIFAFKQESSILVYITDFPN